MRKDMQRREFLRLVGLSGLAAGTIGPLGALACGPSPAGAPAATATPAGAGAAAQPYAGKALRVMGLQFFYAAGLDPLIADFEGTSGMDITMEIYGVNEQFQKADVELAGRTGAYHVLNLNQQSLARAVAGNWIAPLDELIDNPQLTDKEALDLEGFFDYGINTFTQGGKLYGLPVIIGLQVLYGRQDVFDDLGLDGLPKDYDELLRVAKEIHGKDGTIGFVTRAARGRAQNVWSHLQFLYGFGASLVKDFPNDMRPNVDTPEAIEAVTYTSELLGNYSLPQVASAEMDAVVGNFAQGNAAMLIEGAPHIGRLVDPEQSRVADNMLVSMVPGGPAGTFPPLDAHAWVMPADLPQKDKEAAWAFMQWSTSHEAQLTTGLEGPNAVPTRATVTGVPEFREKWSYAGGQWLKAYEDTLGLGVSYYGSPSYQLIIPEWPEFADRLGVAFSEALTKQKTPAQAMRDAQEALTALMKNAGYF